jgi:hypothetical protein
MSLPRGSVGPKQLKPNAVLTGKVANGSLRAIDFATGELPTGPQGPAGAQGLQGPAGERGPEGPVGPAGGPFASVNVRHVAAAGDLADGAKESYDVFCPAGQLALGGGLRGDREDSEATVLGEGRPVISEANRDPPADGGTFTGWRATVLNPSGGVTSGIRPEVWVVCGTPAP